MAISRMKPMFAATSVIALLSGCADNPRALYFWNGEAGAQVNEGGLGEPTAYNTGIQTGKIKAVSTMANRFNQEVRDTVNFAFNSASLTQEARETLSRQANWIRQFPELSFRVYGHTDLVGSNAYNKRLGLRRAKAVVNYLVRSGISRSRLEAVASFGETQPVVVTEQPEVRNRRTVTEVTDFVGRHAAALDGKYAAIIYREYVKSAVPPPDLTNSGVGTISGGTGE